MVDGGDYMQSVLRTNLMAQMAIHHKVLENREQLIERLDRGETVNVEGYSLAASLFRETSALRLADLVATAARPCQVVSITPRAAPPRPDLAALAAAGQVELASAVEEAFWKEIKQFYQRAGDLTRVTFDWLGVAA